MEFEDIPLLHFADIASALLRAAGSGPATVEDAARLLGRDLALAHQPPPLDRAALHDRIDAARDRLAVARLLEMLDGSRFRITPRGRAVLHRHPDGIDDTILVEFPEFRAWLADASAGGEAEDAREDDFESGWAAYRRGRDLTDNPFAPDTAQHAAWEDGWLEAMRRGREGG